MNNSELEKIALERQAARVFLRCYGELTQQKHGPIEHNLPQAPDISTTLAGQNLDIEIAHLYGSEAEAMLVLGRELKPETRAELQALVHLDPGHRLLQALSHILLAKAGKRYQSKRVWLVIRNANPLWQRAEVLAQLPQLPMPPQHPFEQIWLVADMAGLSGLVALYP